MKRLVYLALLLTLCFAGLYGITLWDDPLELAKYDNIVFSGISTKTTDNGIVHLWYEGSAGQRKAYIQRYNTQMQEQWANPLSIETEYGIEVMVATSDNAIVLIYRDPSWSISAMKINRLGVKVWYPDERVAIQSLSYPTSQARFKALSDNSGGVYLTCTNHFNYSIRMQHLSSDGSRLWGSSGLHVNDAYDSTCLPDMSVLANNDVIIGDNKNSQSQVRRLSSATCDTIWVQFITQQEPVSGSVYTKTTVAADSTIYVSSLTKYAIQVMRYDNDGNPLWSQPTIIVNSVDNEIGYYAVTQCLASDNGLIIAWRNDYTCLYTQKLSPTGGLLWDTNGVFVTGDSSNASVPQLHSTNQGGAYIVFVKGISSYSQQFLAMELINSDGSLPVSPTIIANHIPQTDTELVFSSMTINSNLVISWWENRDPLFGIWTQCIDSNGSLLFPESGLDLRTGSYGYVVPVGVASRPNDAIVVWLKRQLFNASNSDDSWLYYQRISATGNHLLSEDGELLVGTAKTYKNLKMLTTPNDYTYIAWIEYSPFKCIKAQIVDPNGALLGGEEGIVIVQGTNQLYEYVLSYNEGAVYVIWTDPVIEGQVPIFGQKLIDGISCWEEGGIVLIGADLANPVSYLALGFVNNRFIGWVSYSIAGSINATAYFSRFDEYGSICENFSYFGTPFKEITQEGFDFNLNANHIIDNDLLVAYSVYYYDRDPEYLTNNVSESRIQRINTSGEMLYGIEGIEGYIPYNAVYYNGYLYGLSSNTSISKMDVNGNLLASFTIPIALESRKHLALKLVDNGRLLVKVVGKMGVNNWFLHFFFNMEAEVFEIHLDCLVAPAFNGNSYSFSDGMYNTYLLMADGVSNDYTDCLYVQKISTGVVSSVDDACQHIPPISSVTNNPNPFGRETKISYILEQNSKCTVNIYNIKGQLVRTLPQDEASKGANQVVWDAKDASGVSVSNGVYFYQISTGDKQVTRKMCLIK